jgi:hypothetical protein
MYGQLGERLRRHFHPTEGVEPYDASDFAHQFGNVVDALLYIPLFCPKFIEVEGSVLLDQGASQAKKFIDAKRASKMSLQDLESSFNFLEMSYAFSNRPADTEEDDELLAQFLEESWRGRLALLFPSRQFRVSILSPGESGSVTAIQFFELR